MKYAHRLRGNKTTSLPYNMVFLDAETRAECKEQFEYHRLKLGSASFIRMRDRGQKYSESNFEFTCAAEFWDRLERFTRKGTKTFLYAHNTHFDFFVVKGLPELERRRWELKSWFIESGVFIMKYAKPGKKLIILDSGNIIKLPLKTIGKTLGYEKLKVDFDTVGWKELQIYCNRDVEILKEFILAWRAFICEHDLGGYRFTLASQALQAYKHRFMPFPIMIHDNMKAYALERESYRGGRTEAFFIGESGKQNFKLVDVNSMYPYVMDKYNYPTGLRYYIENPTLKTLRWALDNYLVIAKVKIEIGKAAIAFRDKKLLFPIGKFEVSLTTEELKWVLENGRIIEVLELSWYDSAPIFKDYVKYFYNLKVQYKKNGNKVGFLMAKLFQNCLYGKFGQRSKKIEVIGECEYGIVNIDDCYDSDSNENFMQVWMGGKIWEITQGGESMDSFPAIASHVTANARLYLYRLMETAKLDNVFYCDTDSLLVNDDGFAALKHLLHPFRLGALDIEVETDKIIIYGAKDYDFGIKVKCKGIRQDAEKIGLNTFRQPHFLKFRSLIRYGITDCAAIRMTIKTLKRKYDKGIIGTDGRVHPHFLSL